VALITFTSLRGAPGASTAALAIALAWPRPRVLVEADPDGGVLAARWGLRTRPGLADLAARAGRGLRAGDVHELGQQVGPLPAIVAPSGADAATAAVRALADVLATLARTDELDVIVDAGRLRPDSAALPLVVGAGASLVVLRPVLDQVAAAAAAGVSAGKHHLLLVGERPHGAAEVADALGSPVLGVLADDGRGAAQPLRRSTAYGRSVRTVAQTLAANARQALSGEGDVLRTDLIRPRLLGVTA